MKRRKKDLGIRIEAREVGRWEPPPTREITGRLAPGRFETNGNEMVDFFSVDAEDVDFSRNRFWSFFADAARFRGCDFSGVRFETVPRFGNNAGSVYTDCSFDGADLRIDGGLGRVRFERCTFDGAKVEGWLSFEGEFVDCRFSTRVFECTFHGRELEEDRRIFDRLLRRPLRRNEFRGNDFSGGELIWTAFKRGIDIAAQRWPEGDEYVRLDRWPERLALVRGSLVARPESERRNELLDLLDDYYASIWEGQAEVFKRRDELAEATEADPFAELLLMIECAL
jgi:hypothetical protein